MIAVHRSHLINELLSQAPKRETENERTGGEMMRRGANGRALMALALT